MKVSLPVFMSTLTAPSTSLWPGAPRTPAAPPVDLYGPIHKALRHLMCDTLFRVGCIDIADAVGCERTLAQLGQLLALCATHLEHENRFVHPALEACQPQASARIAAEHDEHRQHLRELRDELVALRGAAPATRDTLARRLYRHLALFVAANFQHMHIEETAHNTLLWAHYSDAELMQLHDQIVAAVDPREMLEVAHWMGPALTPTERARVVGGMQASEPPEAFLSLLLHIRPRLDDHAWRQLAHALGLPMALPGGPI